MANKQDIGVMNAIDIVEYFNLEVIKDRLLYVQSTCGLTGEGLHEAFIWLDKALSKKDWLINIFRRTIILSWIYNNGRFDKNKIINYTKIHFCLALIAEESREKQNEYKSKFFRHDTNIFDK